MIQGHGDDRYLFKNIDIQGDFSSNVWFSGPPAILQKHLQNQISWIAHYPAPNAEPLNEELKAFHHLNNHDIMVTNGATEAFYLITQAFHETSATIFTPTFSEYEDACRINRIKTTFLDWSMLNSSLTVSSKLVFICNPNNPTGKNLQEKTIIEILKSNPHSYFIIDEAYIHFTENGASLIPFIGNYNNLIIVSSLTKLFTIPGLRIGYVCGPTSVIHSMLNYKMPWSVNALAIEAGRFILDNYPTLKPNTTPAVNLRKHLQSLLEDIPLIKAHATDTHYFLLELEKGSSKDLKSFLLRQYGLLVRDAANFRGLNEQFVRIAAQNEKANQLLANALNVWSRS